MAFDPTELIRTLGSLASISSAYLAYKRAYTDGTIGKRSEPFSYPGATLPEEVKGTILNQSFQASDQSVNDIRVLQVISSDILDSAVVRLNQSRDRLSQVILRGRITEIEDEQAITRSEICYFLSIILKHNGGSFPQGGDLEKLWIEFRCTPLYPEFAIRRIYSS